MLQDLFQKKQQYLNHFFKSIDLSTAQTFLDTVRTCKGTIFLTGVGKSGLVAKKIAATMTSTGSRALYLSPIDALHGDLGILHPNDLFIMLSKSGESDELLNLIPFLRHKKIQLLGIVSNPESRLSKACDLFIHLPLEREICPFNMAPTTSTTIQMIFGDILAIALMQKQNFTSAEYAMNHPAGSIGKRLTLKVSDLMLTGSALPLCKINEPLLDILVELSNKRCGCILIIDEKMKLEGIFTDGDLRRALVNHGSKALTLPIDQLMTKTPRFAEPNQLAWDAMQLMEAKRNNAITCLPVIDPANILLGLIRLHDIVQSGI